VNKYGLTDAQMKDFRAQIEREMASKTAQNRPERRVFTGEVELRASKKGSGPGDIFGYAAKYDKMSQDLGGFFERLAPGCFNSVMNDDVCCLRNHDDDNLLGRSSSGTVMLMLDDIGLKYECSLPDTTCGRDTAEMIRRGDMRGSSFAFNIAMEGQEWDWDGPMPLRTITKIGRLYDVSPVTNPAYLDTEVDMRSFQAAVERRNALQAEIVRRSTSMSHAKARLLLAKASYF
jgi:Escherichia/Staphylococcus phage prohead protease